MTRRLLTVVSLAVLASGGLVVAAGTASAYEDSIICVGSPNQRDPNRYTGICVGREATIYP